MQNYIVTISRTYGSGGKAIGRKISELLGIPYCNRELLELDSTEPEEKLTFSLKKDSVASEASDPVFITDDQHFHIQSEKIRILADQGPCVIVGRCADHILEGRENLIKIFIHASQRNCMRRIMKLYEFLPDEAKAAIASVNRERSAYYQYYTGKEWHRPDQYGLCLDSGALGIDESAEFLCDYIKRYLKAAQ